jgi:6-phosphogluconolactonase
MIRENLLKLTGMPPGNTHPIYIQETASVSAEKYEDEINCLFKLNNGEFPEFDLILLGIGEDGHTASLFSMRDLSSGIQKAVIITEPKELPHTRISLTLPVINHARNVIFIATGKAKAPIIKKVFEKNKRLPASHVHPHKGELFFLLDTEATSFIRYEKTYSQLEELQKQKLKKPSRKIRTRKTKKKP